VQIYHELLQAALLKAWFQNFFDEIIIGKNAIQTKPLDLAIDREET
jgi:hypothetical protein